MMIILTKIKGSDGDIFLQNSFRTRLRELLILYYMEFVLIIINSQKRADKDFIREFCRVRICFEIFIRNLVFDSPEKRESLSKICFIIV